MGRGAGARRLDCGRSLNGAARTRLAVAMVAGLAAVVAGAALGGAGELLEAIVGPPVIVRAALVAVATVVGLALLLRSVTLLAGGDGPERDLPTMIRGVRLVFLAVAALAAAAGWLVGHPLPLVVGLVIAGVDVLETSFLLLVASRRQ